MQPTRTTRAQDHDGKHAHGHGEGEYIITILRPRCLWPMTRPAASWKRRSLVPHLVLFGLGGVVRLHRQGPAVGTRGEAGSVVARGAEHLLEQVVVTWSPYQPRTMMSSGACREATACYPSLTHPPSQAPRESCSGCNGSRSCRGRSLRSNPHQRLQTR
jgi:hypothetical protein